MMRENTRPRPKNSQMDVRKILRFSFSRPGAWASLVSLEMASGNPAVENGQKQIVNIVGNRKMRLALVPDDVAQGIL